MASESGCPIADEDLFSDFVTWSRAHLWSGDIDPIYPWIKRVFDRLDLDEEERLWRLYLYTAFYNLDALRFLTDERGYRVPTVIPIEDLNLPTGTERRCFRGQPEPAFRNIRHAVETGLFDPVLWDLRGRDGWHAVRDQFESVPFNGPWASYKWADLMMHVMGYPLEAASLGVGGASETAGPIPGMVKLTGQDWRRCANDLDLQNALLDECHGRGVPFRGLDQLETCLCDFNSAVKAHYYVGHDIDLYGSQIDSAPAVWWEARADVFPPIFLGEQNGWTGVRDDLQRLYADHGVVEWWKLGDLDVDVDPDRWHRITAVAT